MGLLGSLLRSLTRKTEVRRVAARGSARFQPWLETLEDRTVLTAATFSLCQGLFPELLQWR
jgi:hypothetical protein